MGGGPVFQALLNLGKIYKPNLTVRMFFRWVGEKPPTKICSCAFFGGDFVNMINLGGLIL